MFQSALRGWSLKNQWNDRFLPLRHISCPHKYHLKLQIYGGGFWKINLMNMDMNIAIYIHFKWIHGIFLQRQTDTISSLITVVKISATSQYGLLSQGIKHLLRADEYPLTNTELILVICSCNPQMLLINSIKYLDFLIISPCYNLPRPKRNMFPEMTNALNQQTIPFKSWFYSQVSRVSVENPFQTDATLNGIHKIQF